MDFYRPTGWGAVPVVLQVHGGQWAIGNRTDYVKATLVSAFLSRGIAFATIDYRLLNGRGASEDVACAIRYLRASASKLVINGSRIGAMGQSAGGQLVSLLGATDMSAGFDVGQYPHQSSRVQAVVDEWGPVIFDAAELKILSLIPSVFGTSNLALLKAYSPLTYLTKDDPPFLVIQGSDDTLVPPYQSQQFARGLQRAGVPEQLMLVQHAGHYLKRVQGAPPETPTPAQVQSDLVTFFVNRLRG